MLWVLRWMPVCLSFSGSIRWALSIFESGISIPASFTNFLTFSGTFSDKWWLYLGRSFNCIVIASTKCSRFLTLYLKCYITLPQCIHVLLKQTDGEESFSFSSSLIICHIPSLKTSRNLDFICSIKTHFNSSNLLQQQHQFLEYLAFQNKDRTANINHNNTNKLVIVTALSLKL